MKRHVFYIFLIAITCVSTLTAETLLTDLNHWDQSKRRETLAVIANSPDQYSSELFVRKVALVLTNDKNCGVRTSAAEALHSMAKTTDITLATKNLEQALRDPINTVRRAALTTICSPTAQIQLPVQSIEPLLEDVDRSVRIVAKACPLLLQDTTATQR